MGNDLSLRHWCQADCRMIYEWRMNPAVRDKSFNKNEFPYSEHEQWFRRFLYSPYSFGYILEKHGVPVAQIRFDKTMNEGYYNISISTAPDFMGKGYGSAILEIACAQKELLQYAKYFVAEVFEDNIPSKKIFEKNGFKTTAKTSVDGHTVLLFKRDAILTQD